jgi:hypothetical protein
MKNATPTKLRNGDWGARVEGVAAEGDQIKVTAKSGKSWTAIVAHVFWSGDGASVVAVRSSRTPRERTRRGTNGECRCGWGDDLLSWGGHIAGRRYRCPDCGGWAEAC